MLLKPLTAAFANSVVSALGRTNGTTTLFENRGPSLNGDVRAKTKFSSAPPDGQFWVGTNTGTDREGMKKGAGREPGPPLDFSILSYSLLA